MDHRESTIELRIDSLEHFFDPLDPFPVPTRDLAPAAEAFIVGWARELHRSAAFAIVIHTSEVEPHTPEAEALKGAIVNHFNNRARAASRDLQDLLGIGRVSLVIGLGVLVLCIFLGRLAASTFGEGALARYLSEGLMILGWVANWRPVEIFLYDWWPVARRIRLLRRLAAAHVEVRAASASEGEGASLLAIR